MAIRKFTFKYERATSGECSRKVIFSLVIIPDSSEDNETIAEESADANEDVDEREDCLDQGQEDQ
jgi:hypothetical protein